MNLSILCNIIFREKHKYHTLTDKDKEDYFFIFNQYISKFYPEKALSFNKKETDKVLAMDIWFDYLKTVRFIPNFYPKKKKKTSKDDIDKFLKTQNLNKYEEMLLKTYYSENLIDKISKENTKNIQEEKLKKPKKVKK